MDRLEEDRVNGQRFQVVDVPQAAENLVNALKGGIFERMLQEPPTPEVLRRILANPKDDYAYVGSFKSLLNGVCDDLSQILLLTTTRQDNPSTEELQEWLVGNILQADVSRNNALIAFRQAIEIGELLDHKLGKSWRSDTEFIWKLRDKADIATQVQDIIENMPQRPIPNDLQQQASDAIHEFCITFVHRMTDAIQGISTNTQSVWG